MGLGDQLLATGMARGAAARGKRIAFGDGKRILWDKNSEQVFRGNPNIAAPGCEHLPNLEWVGYYKGRRIYNEHDVAGHRWVWNMDFRPTPGEMFFSEQEKRDGRRHGDGFVLVEPNIELWKSVAPNKDWGHSRYQQVVDRLRGEGARVCQFAYGPQLERVEAIKANSFRDAVAILSNARMYLGPEGGLHHAAAAVGTDAVVLFGGFIPPQVTGYPNHANLTGGAAACGSLQACEHCRQAMAAITVEEVFDAAKERL